MNPYQNYFANQVKTASAEQILIMLYDGAIRFLRQARNMMAEGDRIGKMEKISRVVAILTELSNTLDFEKGGEIAENLDGLYWYMIRQLTSPDARDATEPMDTAENILLELREGWVQAIENNRSSDAEAGNSGARTENAAKSMQAAIG